jgi:hypothetical protein
MAGWIGAQRFRCPLELDAPGPVGPPSTPSIRCPINASDGTSDRHFGNGEGGRLKARKNRGRDWVGGQTTQQEVSGSRLGWKGSPPIARGRRVPEAFATRTTSGTSGSLRRDLARPATPARQEPRVDAEPHGGPPALTHPDRFRPQPPELGQAFERALHNPGLRQARPLVSGTRPGP